jgi:cytochrome c oxidase subunit 2
MAMLDRRLMLVLAGAGAMLASPALAGMGQPSPWQMGFQEAASPIMAQITAFHD